MTKKTEYEEITTAHLTDYVDATTDFSFELRCLRILLQLDFRCDHGGQYVDDVTGKHRQFDIQADRLMGERIVMLAVECKNLSKRCPLLVSRMPRLIDESYHHLIRFSQEVGCVQFIDCHGPYEYHSDKLVGKCQDQVRKAVSGKPEAARQDREETFDKWSQALASASSLAKKVADVGKFQTKDETVLIVPVIVVPDGTLWAVDYHATGSRSSNPETVDRCSFYVGRECIDYRARAGAVFKLSHLEMVTPDGLVAIVRSICDPSPYHNRWFPREISF